MIDPSIATQVVDAFRQRPSIVVAAIRFSLSPEEVRAVVETAGLKVRGRKPGAYNASPVDRRRSVPCVVASPRARRETPTRRESSRQLDIASADGVSAQPGDCAHCGGKHAPAYPLETDALVEGRCHSAGTPMCLRCTCLALDASTNAAPAERSSR